MARNPMLSKRSQSPVGITDHPVHEGDSLSQMDRSSFGKPVAPENTPSPEIPEMPPFLRLTNEEIHEKYGELSRLESERLNSVQWPRLEPDPVLDRYSNIHPWADNRIHLQVPEGVNDYINASPVTLVSTSAKQSELKAGVQDKYICMQGPKKETVDHTWHMLWHELANPSHTTPAVIIMLCALRGPDPNRPGETKEQCFTYFPPDENSPPLIINETDILGESFKATVRFVSRQPTPPGTSIEIRQLSMSLQGKEDKQKPIWHFLYPSWPDFGTLEEQNVASIISLMTLSREKNGGTDNPRLVHCSAGVGRTGTFLALEFLIGELMGGAWEKWDVSEYSGRDAVYDTVNQLRKQRCNMVQAYEQYAFLYEVLRKMWEEKYGTHSIGGDRQHEGVQGKWFCGGQTATVYSASGEAKVVKANTSEHGNAPQKR